MLARAGVPAQGGGRQPNQRLAALIREAGSSNAGLARRVNMVGAERGVDLRYDKTSVARWLRGQQPRGIAPSLIAEALGRKLGRPVTVDEIGMADGRNGSSSVGLRFAPTAAATIEVVSELWRSDVSHRDFLLGPSFAIAALVAPSRDWLITQPDETVAREPGDADEAGRSPGQHVGASDVEAVREATKMLRALDHRFGAGHVRSMVVHYLDGVVADLLAGWYSDRVGRELFAAAAELTELAGYMAVDAGRHGLAQRYYIQALRLAQAADDRGYGGYVLAAGMSHLAGHLGSPHEIAQLARAAQEGARGKVTATTSAMFYAAEARGHAVVGDESSCTTAMSRATKAMARSRPDEDPVWISHFTPAYLADEFAHCYRDLGRARQCRDQAEAALSGHSESHVRRRAVDTFVLATAYLQDGEVDGACAAAHTALDLIGRVRSARGADYLRDFDRRLEPYQTSATVTEFRGRVAELVPRVA